MKSIHEYLYFFSDLEHRLTCFISMDNNRHWLIDVNMRDLCWKCLKCDEGQDSVLWSCSLKYDLGGLISIRGSSQRAECSNEMINLLMVSFYLLSITRQITDSLNSEGRVKREHLREYKIWIQKVSSNDWMRNNPLRAYLALCGRSLLQNIQSASTDQWSMSLQISDIHYILTFVWPSLLALCSKLITAWAALHV